MAENHSTDDKYLIAVALRDQVVSVSRVAKDDDDFLEGLQTMNPTEARRLARELDVAANVAEGKAAQLEAVKAVSGAAHDDANALHLASECADLLSDACAEIEQMSRIIGTMPPDASGNDLVLRGLAVRLHSLNSVIYWALLRDGTFNPDEASETVHGPAQWKLAA
jgi:hypothetical protein